MVTLGQRIRELRDKKDLSLREFARKLDVSAAFMSDVELGRRNPTDEKLSEIAKQLGTSVQELKQYDSRLPIDEIRTMTARNPMYGYAFRKAVESNLTPEEIVKALEEKKKQGKKSK